MLHVRKLMKKSLKNICKLIKINKKFFCHISYHQKRLLLRDLAILIGNLLFDFVFIYELYYCFTYNDER